MASKATTAETPDERFERTVQTLLDTPPQPKTTTKDKNKKSATPSTGSSNPESEGNEK